MGTDIDSYPSRACGQMAEALANVGEQTAIATADVHDREVRRMTQSRIHFTDDLRDALRDERTR
jgi:hypothetical protein